MLSTPLADDRNQPVQGFFLGMFFSCIKVESFRLLGGLLPTTSVIGPSLSKFLIFCAISSLHPLSVLRETG